MNLLPLINLIFVLGIHRTAIYAFFILANSAGNATMLMLANFTLDGNNPKLFQHFPDVAQMDLEYNQLVYSKQDLINAEHTLVISTSGVDNYVYVNFDYVTYMWVWMFHRLFLILQMMF